MTDFVELWLRNAKARAASDAATVEKYLADLRNTDSSYYRAHVVMAKAYRECEGIFRDALTSHQTEGKPT